MAQGHQIKTSNLGAWTQMSSLFIPGFQSLRMAERFSKNCKALEIETETKMENSLRWLLLFDCAGPSM
jgi:hypothetical protein